MRASRLEPGTAARSFLRAWQCEEALAVFSMDVSVDGVKKVPVFTVISRSNVDAAVGKVKR